ncbi:MAG: hypothetical protein HOP15_12110 [Planctomycetes bacterium]|nr:hypothetical protein [Planctomycetota bacterium]
MSNRERITRAAEEARLTEVDKVAKKAAKPATKATVNPAVKAATRVRPKRAPKAPVRMKVVWDVCNGAGQAVQTFAYPDKAAAEAATLALTRSTGGAHTLRPSKVPME